MPLDLLAGKLVLETRQQLHDLYLLWILLRNPAADTRPGGQPDVDASAMADLASLILSKAVIIAGGVSASTAKGPAIDTWAQLLGTQRQPAVGAGGQGSGTFASTGAALVTGDILTYQPTGLKYQFVGTTGTYVTGQALPISGIDTGPQTDLPAGAVLTWLTNRPGVVKNTVTILPQADGSGLSGGTGPETDEDLQARLQWIRSNPPASGNDAQYQSAVSQILASVQQCFTIPGVFGPDGIGVMFTLRPGTPGANRIPTAAQMASVLSLLGGQMPASDGIYMCAIVPQPVNVALKVIWAQGSPGWADSALFPLYHAGNMVSAAPNAAGAMTPTAFRLQSSAMTEVPQVGQNIAFLDLPNQAFRRKRILSVTAISSTQYDITVDTTGGVSDTSYTPTYSVATGGQPCCPWSDSLQTLISPVVTYFDTLGPGEQFAGGDLFDPGRRRRRSPPSPQFWPNLLTNRMLGGASVPQPPQGPQQNQPAVATLFTVPALQDVELMEPVPPFSANVGVPGVSSNMLTLAALVAFPE